MSDSSFGSEYDRARRIHELERLADDEREHLRTETAALVKCIQDGRLVRSLGSAVVSGASGALGNGSLLGPIASLVFSRFTGGQASPAGPHRSKFPWMSAVGAGMTLLRLGKWFKRRKRTE